MKTLVKTIYGSHLYGTSTPDSDRDYKGVFLPPLRSCILNGISKSINNTTGESNTKNTSQDIDTEFYSLQYFLLTLGVKGETVFLDMIHTPPEATLESSEVWRELVKNKNKFYTKNLKSYLGYCRTQAAKYGVKGSRLNDAKMVLEFLGKQPSYLKLSEIWDSLPKGENIKFIEIADAIGQDNRAYDVCGRKLMANTKASYAYETVKTFYDNYGARAQQAAENKGIDWKAISHAFRAGFQLKSLYSTGDILFPLPEAKFITDVKQGKFHYKDAGIAQQLEDLVDEVEDLASKSNYPEKVDIKWIQNFIMDVYTSF